MQDTLETLTKVILTQVKIEQRNQYLTKTVVRLRRDLSLLKKQYVVIQKELVDIRKHFGDAASRSQSAVPMITPMGVVRLRRKLGITEVELALLIGVTAVTVSRWENAKNPLRVSNKIKIAELRTLGRREVRKRLMLMRGMQLREQQ